MITVPRWCAGLAALSTMCAPTFAWAGPPYVTDDPEPTDLHHWEIYGFVDSMRVDSGTSTDVGLDLNYGGAQDLQLTMSLPFARDTGKSRTLGDIEMAAKYRVLHQQGAGHVGLDVAIFPRVFLPTGRGSTRARLLLPVWVQRDMGKWSLFGGGGLVLNPGAGQKDNIEQGAVVTRQMVPGFQLGLEYYGSGPASVGDRAMHGINLGTVVHVKGPWSLLGSIGKGLNRQQTIVYASLNLNI